jgi:hypothetical protein
MFSAGSCPTALKGVLPGGSGDSPQ